MLRVLIAGAELLHSGTPQLPQEPLNLLRCSSTTPQPIMDPSALLTHPPFPSGAPSHALQPPPGLFSPSGAPQAPHRPSGREGDKMAPAQWREKGSVPAPPSGPARAERRRSPIPTHSVGSPAGLEFLGLKR